MRRLIQSWARRAWLAFWLQERRRWHQQRALVPLTVPGLKLFVRVESLAGLADNASVAAWADASGYANHLAQTVAANRPVYRSVGGDAPAVYFDGTNDVLATAGNAFKTDQHTVFLVARPLATASNDAVGTGSTGSGDVLLMVAYGEHQRGANWRGANANLLDGATLVHTGAFALFEQEVTATQITLRLNGVTDATLAMAGVAAGVSKPVYLGSRNSAWFFQGYVRALLVYEGNPSAADKAAIRAYLIATYGIPTPYPPPPAPGAPANLAAVDGGGGTAYLSWDMSEPLYATGVKVERKPSAQPDTSYAEVGEAGPGDGEYSNVGVGAGSFTYRVRAYNVSGYSAYSNSATVTIA